MKEVTEHEALTAETFDVGASAGYIARMLPSGEMRMVISIEDDKYFVEDIAWTVAHGDIPNGKEVYHVNGDGLDNRLANLALKDSTEPATF